MKKFTIFFIALFILIDSYSQHIESAGAGVIDFLLTNPKTANRYNASEAAALNIIRNLLNLSSQRKHEVNVAQAGRDEIIINTTSGNQATVYLDTQGNVYLLYNGTIYPISDGLVNQAKNESVKPSLVSTQPSIKNATLPDYNLSNLNNEFRFEKIDKLEEYFLQEKEETIGEIANKMGVKKEDIYMKKLSMGWCKGDMISIQDLKDYKSNVVFGNFLLHEKKLSRVDNGQFKGSCEAKVDGQVKTQFSIFINVGSYKPNLITTFTCNWARDFDRQGFEFEDFQGIKRSFNNDENLLFVMGYTTDKEGNWTFEIFEAASGKIVYSKTGEADLGAKVLALEKEGEKLPSGVYLYNFILRTGSKESLSKSEKFEIIKNSDI